MAFGKKKEEVAVQHRGGSVIEAGIEIYGERIIGNTSITVKGIVYSIFEIGADVIVDHEGYIEGNIACRNCVVKGKVVGNVSAAGHLTITDEGTIIGDIDCASLEVNRGGNFTGTCNKGRNIEVMHREKEEYEAAI
ncbi:MAG: polymer-forming cytoskeletal protein [Defluviitaleaceae bacterium]|nr:polymer-forming cytoskeletal protein [Defluviitaleaceae bacterium]